MLAAFIRGEIGPKESLDFDVYDEDGRIIVLEANWNAVQAYELCGWTVAAQSTLTTSRIVFVGIDAREIESACRMVRVPRALHQDVARRIRIMADAARPHRNGKR